MVGGNRVPHARGGYFADDGGVYYLSLFGKIELFDWVGDPNTATVLARLWNRKLH